MSFMTKIKAKYIIKLAKKVEQYDPYLSAELNMLVAGATNRPHPRPTITLGSVLTAMKTVVQTLKDEGVDFALAGGLAVKYWVDIRESLDIDFVLHTKDIEKIMKLFPNGQDLPLMYSVRIDGTDIDFLKGDLFSWTDEALKNAPEKSDLGVKMKIVPPEYLVLFKFRAGRETDLKDIKGLISLDGVAEKARLLVNKFMPDELDDIEQMIRENEFGV